MLGRGSFGKVMLCRKKDEGPEGELYAMKTLRKQALVKRNQLEHTATERNILQNIQHPFLVNMRFAFQVSHVGLAVVDLSLFTCARAEVNIAEKREIMKET